MRVGIGAVGLLFLLAGCTDYGPSQVAPLNAISVRAAFDDVADGLTDFRSKVDAPDPVTGVPHKFGLITCRVIVHFNIAASASQSDKVSATLAAPIEAFKIGASGEAAAADAAQRGNSVLVDIGSINNDTCSAYEKPSDMYPPPASTAQSKGDQSNTQSEDKGQQTNGGNQTNGTAQNNQGSSQHGQGANANPTPNPVVAPGSLVKMLTDGCSKGNKADCNELGNMMMMAKFPLGTKMVIPPPG